MEIVHGMMSWNVFQSFNGTMFIHDRRREKQTDSRGPIVSLPALGRLQEHASKHNCLKP